MKKIVDYIILDSRYYFILSDKVCKEIEKGWQPLGGVSVNGTWLKKIYAQAMVKYSDE